MPGLPGEVLAHFGLRVTAPLGGRLNQHWRVQRGREDLVLRRWASAPEDVHWERALRAGVAARGWPAAPDVGEVHEAAGACWSLAPWLPGAPWPQKHSPAELRQRGRLLAEFHLAVGELGTQGPQRPGWRRAEDTLRDPDVERLLANHPDPEERGIYLWHLHRARELDAELGLGLAARAPVLIHGDFTHWNLLFCGDRLTGLLDFELSRLDHRVADFALSWRGAYDDLVHAYDEVSPLEDVEWALLTPVWWASLLEGAFQLARRGGRDDGWTARMLSRRSALMGAVTG